MLWPEVESGGVFLEGSQISHATTSDSNSHNIILAIAEHPEPASCLPQGFSFCGYDIIDAYEPISVLLNCGGFPSVFSSSELNECGLLDTLDRASAIAKALRTSHAGDSHCWDCRVWAMARYTPGDSVRQVADVDWRQS